MEERMAILASCWLIIEKILIPDGFLKWFCLSFYIHPVLLFACQVFLWLKVLQRLILIPILYPLNIIFSVGLLVFNIFRNIFLYIFRFVRSTDVEATGEVDDESFEILNPICSRNQVAVLYSCSSVAAQVTCHGEAPFRIRKVGFEEDKNLEDAIPCEEDKIEGQSFPVIEDQESMAGDISSSVGSSSPFLNLDENVSGDLSSPSICSSNSQAAKEADMNEYLSSTYISNSLEAEPRKASYELKDEAVDIFYVSEDLSSSSICSSNSPAAEADMNEYLSSTYISNSLEVEPRKASYELKDEAVDIFYENYAERMRWFDVLNHDRTCGLRAIMKNQAGSPSSFYTNIEPVSKMARKRLLRSLESDLELVYVAQSCLSWEALYHQYTKVEALALSSSQNGVFCNDVASEFQNFQVLLERFMEDERCEESKRVWNYVKGRFSLRSLLQVPKVSEVSGFMEQEKEEIRGEAVSIKEVLKAIEKCIEAFWEFLKTDQKKPWWKGRSSLWGCPPVEDPRDLVLLADLSRKLQRKELWLKDTQGKQRCWFRRVVNPVEESQRKEILFTMIEMKLVSRVLQMSVVTSSQLKWCQEKLDNIEFNEGKIFRTCNTTTGPLFPP